MICLLIVFEFIMTGLGFCGHDHNHNYHCMNDRSCETSYSDYTLDYLDQHPAPSHHETEKSSQISHCSCLGGFLTEIYITIFKIVKVVTYHQQQDQDNYHYFYAQVIYRPPIVTA